MWIPAPVYEKLPQLWLLVGLLFISAGTYIGFDYALTTYYVGLGFACCIYGVGIHIFRTRNRQGRYGKQQSDDNESIEA